MAAEEITNIMRLISHMDTSNVSGLDSIIWIHWPRSRWVVGWASVFMLVEEFSSRISSQVRLLFCPKYSVRKYETRSAEAYSTTCHSRSQYWCDRF
jgi:hypothetical protein